MGKKLGKNAVYVGSFNPMHLGHVGAIKEGLDYFDYVHVFVRYNEGTDLTDWATKEKWFAHLNEELDGRVKIYKEVTDTIKGKEYGIEMFYEFMDSVDEKTGETMDGFLFGDDYEKIKDDLQKRFPNKIIFIGKRNGFNSTEIRNNLEEHKDWVPEYVYQSLKELEKKA